ncbi:MAG: hypothetical protein Unbinned7358contig1001_17 [Prokaryotic dsDNA virus sp.]|nr:MAG: hypothetical protein Unbinned7358contig1001_17 [Prokaryotic dsDNA virus sp.]|tara:strand:- start:355 stop:513 length:159 start_codon:yes stop_codon:yes gene_type:complete
MNEFEIVERSSGFWVVDGHGFIDGPFFELEDAEKSLEKCSEESVDCQAGGDA